MNSKLKVLGIQELLSSKGQRLLDSTSPGTVRYLASLTTSGFKNLKKGVSVKDQIVIPEGVAGTSARRLLRRYLKELAEVESHSTDLQCEIAVCEELLKGGSVDVSFAGQAHDMRRAFYAVKRLLG